MDWKEKFWRALGAEQDARGVLKLGDLALTFYEGEFTSGICLLGILDPHDPSVPLEVLLKGFQKKLGDNWTIKPWGGDGVMIRCYVPEYEQIRRETLRSALIAAICAVAGIEKEGQ